MAGDEAGQQCGEDVDTAGLDIIKPTSNKSGRDPFQNRKFRWWFITWNNPSHPEDKTLLLSWDQIIYIKFQYEKGKTGTKHYQGVFYLKGPKTCTTLRSKFPGCGYMAPVKDTKGAVKYCGKSDTRIDGPWEQGTLPKQGARSDLLECKTIVDSGGGMDELFEQQFSNAVRYGRGLSQYVNLVAQKNPRKTQTTCYVYYGDSGMGKTEAAKAETAAWGGKVFWLTLESGMGGKVWWDGYNGEPNVVIDEFECQLRLVDFKRMIDSSPYKVPVKGGYVEFKALRVWVLTNYCPDAWYLKSAPPGPQRNALLRRIHYREDFFKEEDGGLGKFQGQSTWQNFVDMRTMFVTSQQDGTYVVKK